MGTGPRAGTAHRNRVRRPVLPLPDRRSLRSASPQTTPATTTETGDRLWHPAVRALADASWRSRTIRLTTCWHDRRLKVSQEPVHLSSDSYTPGNASSSTEG